MNQIKKIVVSTKINENDLKMLEKTKEILYEKGELSRNTNSCLLRESLKTTIAETLDGKKERTDEKLEKMEGKLRTNDNEIGKLEAKNETLRADNTRLKDEKTSLEIKLKNSEKSIGELAYTDLALQDAYQKLKKENQDLKGHQLSPKMKGIIEMAEEMEIFKYMIKKP